MNCTPERFLGQIKANFREDHTQCCEKHVMVAEDSRLSGLGTVSALTGVIMCVLGQDTSLSQCLSQVQVYKSLLHNEMLGKGDYFPRLRRLDTPTQRPSSPFGIKLLQLPTVK